MVTLMDWWRTEVMVKVVMVMSEGRGEFAVMVVW